MQWMKASPGTTYPKDKIFIILLKSYIVVGNDMVKAMDFVKWSERHGEFITLGNSNLPEFFQDEIDYWIVLPDQP
jgi:hypothetical protein